MVKEVRAPRGTDISCKGWLQEAAMRLLMNNLDPEVAEKPSELIVYGGTGKAARSWDAYEAIIKTLKELENDETLLVQSGKPVAVFKTHTDAPRVLISNSMMVPHWANWEEFWRLESMGLIMYGQMTAGSWIYIGTQGILQGTYECFAEAARQHFGGTLRGKLVLSGGLGGMGGAQPLAATMNEGVFIGVEVDSDRIKKRLQTKYLDKMTDSFDEALDWAREAQEKGKPLSIGLVGNSADVVPMFVDKGIVPDLLTDQTSAHDALNGYVPNGIPYEEALKLRKSDPDKYVKIAYKSMVEHCRAMVRLQEMGAVTFDYGNNLRGQAKEAGFEEAFEYKGFAPLFIRPLFCEGYGPFRWVALSGKPEDIHRTDEAIIETFPEKESLIKWIKLAHDKVAFQGLPSRICWLGYGERAKFGKIINNLVKNGEISAPIVIGRDHLDTGSVASPNRETEEMKDGSDAIADWPMLNAMLNAVSGATWVSIHHGGGVGIGYSLHAGMVIVADGTPEAEARLERVLTCDPGSGIARHADAGYEKAIECARKNNLKIPMME